MDAVKAKSSPPVQATQAPKRTDTNQQSNQAAQADAVAKKATEQAPRPTTNTRGETLGRHLNVTA